MKTTELKIFVGSALLFLSASSQALQPEVLYSFRLGPSYPRGTLVEGNDGNFYGTTVYGGDHGLGTVFRVSTNGLITTLTSFTHVNGAYPETGLVLGSNGNFYGTTSQGGSSNGGTVFEVTTNGLLSTLVRFTGANGWNPQARLVLGRDGNFYGTTESGGSGGNNPGEGSGTVFKVTSNGNLTPLVSFNNANGARPRAPLVEGNDGNFYGTTAYGGSGATDTWSGYGTVFRVTPNGVLTSLVSFTGPNGASPEAGLLLGYDGDLYGTTAGGGSGGCSSGNRPGCGTVFRVTTNGVLTTLVSFIGTDGWNPTVGLVVGGDGNFYGTTANGGSGSAGTAFRVTTNGVLTTLFSFTWDDGSFEGHSLGDSRSPQGLVAGRDGNFYGTTANGGRSDQGTVFKMTPTGLLTPLFSFSDPDGARPDSGVAWGSDGNLYGTTVKGGSNNAGTVFRLTSNGLLTSLFSFNKYDNSDSSAGLVLGRDGNLYGTTRLGGSFRRGSLFRVTTNGLVTTLVSFTYTNGAPTGLVLGNDGNFYGTTGGWWGCCDSDHGTVFQVTTDGMLTTLISFTGPNGAFPGAGLALGGDGNFYGITSRGGGNGQGTMFQVTTSGVLTTLHSFTDTDAGHPHELTFGGDGNFYGMPFGGGGTVLRVSSTGVWTTLTSFNDEIGTNPNGSLVLGRDGSLYGTTFDGGRGDAGTVFQVTTNGVWTTLVSFNGANGAHPRSRLVFGNDGSLYGTTSGGGPGGGGTIFRIAISRFNSVRRQSSGSVLLTGLGPPNGSYRLWASADLSLPLASWIQLTSASFDSNGNLSYIDESAATNTSRFYQLSIP